MDRRKVLSASAVGGLAALAGCASGTSGSSTTGGARTVFSVAQPMLPIVGTSDMFPVRRIYCIGRNYAAHAREMGSDPTREPPFFFQKPSDAIQFVAPGTTADHPYPTLTKNYHYEIELVAALDKGGRNVSDRAGARPRLRLHDRPRHDPARPAAGDGRREEAVGDRQELRPLGADRADPPGGAGRPLHQGRDHAQGQRRGQAERRPELHDLERRRADLAAQPGVRADAGRHHLQRHAGERRPGRCRAT